MLWIDYFRERDTTNTTLAGAFVLLWIDYFRERDTTQRSTATFASRCGLITLGNEIQR